MIFIERSGNSTRIDCVGQLEVSDYPRLLQLTLDWQELPSRHLLLNWTELETVEATALRGVAELCATVLTQEGRVALVGCRKEMQEMLRQAHWGECFEWYESLAMAQQKLG